MSSKISALPAATQVNNADLVTIVQGGVNKKCVRSQMFAFPAGESFGCTANGAGITLDASGNCFIGVPLGQSIFINQLTGSGFVVQTTGEIDMVGTAGQPLNIVIGTSSISIDAGGHITIAEMTTFTPTISYDDQGAGSFSPSPPSVFDAIQRMAAVVATLNGAPIP